LVETVGNARNPGLPGLRIIMRKSGKPDLRPRRSCRDRLHSCAGPLSGIRNQWSEAPSDHWPL